MDVTSITNFNPHSPCGERPRSLPSTPARKKFQSTLPLRGATPASRRLRDMIEFQSTLPLRGATRLLLQPPPFVNISIHTPLAGSDRTMTPIRPLARLFQSTLPLRGATPSNAVNNASSDFNPHSPCGERLLPCVADGMRTYFNPHSPCGERHSVRRARPLHAVISIHTPLAGSDVFGGYCFVRTRSYFNPHSPCGERPS